MATELQEMLRSLCSGSEWTYAIFWRLKPRPQMVLTWDDAYYNSCRKADLSKVNCSTNVVDHFDGHRDLHDPLELALAKLSCSAYPVGKGIIGQVAVTGKHKWISFDHNVNNSLSSIEDLDAWRTQVLAGIKTVFIVAVPCGVVQLGSSLKVNEDMKLVTHVRVAFNSIQEALLQHQSSCMPCDVDSSLDEPKLPMQVLLSEVILDNVSNLDNVLYGGHSNVCSSKLPYPEKRIEGPNVLPESGISPKAVVKVVRDCEELKHSNYDQNSKLLEEIYNIGNLGSQKQVDVKKYSGTAIEGESSSLDHRCSVPESILRPYFQNLVKENCTSSTVSVSVEAFAVDLPCIPSGFSNSSSSGRLGASVLDTNQSISFKISEPSKELEKNLVKKLDFEVGLNYLDIGSELHEALGPTFLKSNHCDSEEQIIDSRSVKVLEETNNSQITTVVGSDNLLEAVVAKACQTCFDDKSEQSFSELREHPLSRKTMFELASFSKVTINSEDYLVDQQSHMEEDCLQSSERNLGISSSAISSAYPSSGVEVVRRASEPSRNSRKRPRPGETRRPRPRDRQLIQDRLKELRELVPNGSKCSIDSLLERTIRHMLFLQSITKHGDKLNQCNEPKFRQSEMGTKRTSNCEQGSSWAVEVESQLKVHSIMVENLPKSGQLLVEMLCEDCSHFLEIAEATRSLGLTILEGASEAHGDKIWICFLVEGQNNLSFNRMDILWSLVEILQLKASYET